MLFQWFANHIKSGQSTLHVRGKLSEDEDDGSTTRHLFTACTKSRFYGKEVQETVSGHDNSS